MADGGVDRAGLRGSGLRRSCRLLRVETERRMQDPHGELRGILRQQDRDLISDVEMARMLMPRSASVSNILAAMPALDRMPMPTATFTTSVSVMS